MDSVPETMSMRKKSSQLEGTLYMHINTLGNLAVPGAGRKPELMERAQIKEEPLH